MRRLARWAIDNRGAAAVLGLYLILATAYNLADPLFEPPDELLHYDFVHFLQGEARLPVVDPSGPETEYHQPPLYYVLTALVTAPLGPRDPGAHALRNPFWGYEIGQVGRDNKNQYLHDPAQDPLIDPIGLRVHLTRALSTLFGLVTVLLSYVLARRFLSRSLAVASMAIVAFTPNFLLTSGAVTNDSLVILFSAAAGLILVDLVARTDRPPPIEWAGLGGLLGLAMLAKLSAWPLLPLAAAAVVLLALRLRSWRILVVAGSLTIAGIALLAGWWVIRNLALYGDPTGLTSMWSVWGVRKPLTWRTFLTELGHFRTTFWANFGYGNIPLPGWVYTLADLFVAGGIAGLLVALVRRRHLPLERARRDQVLVLGAWFVLTAGALIWYLQRTIAVTGRQLYPVLPVIALGLAAGWAALLPRRLAGGLSAAIAGAMLVWATSAWAGALLPAYRPAPRLPIEQAERAVQYRLGWQFGDDVTLLGYDLSPVAARPGDKVTITFYWQPLRRLDRNYAVFVHLLGGGDRLAGARDTYPGLGNDPTIYWTPGEVVVDTIGIPVAPGARGPILLDIEAGLYDLEMDERLAIRDGNGDPVGYPVIGRVKLQGEGSVIQAPSHSLAIPFAGSLALEGYDLSDTVQSPGSQLTLTLHWSPGGPLAVDYRVFVHLVDDTGAIVAQGDGPPCEGRYPTTAWAAGEHLADEHMLVVPTDAAPGSYHLLVGLYDPRSNDRLPVAAGGDHVQLGQDIQVRR
jgi:4-amino-4-deoxy-L-arabinose transferase-like glycosyltransferase